MIEVSVYEGAKLSELQKKTISGLVNLLEDVADGMMQHKVFSGIEQNVALEIITEYNGKYFFYIRPDGSLIQWSKILDGRKIGGLNEPIKIKVSQDNIPIHKTE